MGNQRTLKTSETFRIPFYMAFENSKAFKLPFIEFGATSIFIFDFGLQSGFSPCNRFDSFYVSQFMDQKIKVFQAVDQNLEYTPEFTFF